MERNKTGIKPILLVILFLLLNVPIAMAQVGINNTSPDASAMLDIVSTDKGILIPRVDIADLSTALPVTTTPLESLLVYNTNQITGPGFFYWDGSAWVSATGAKNINDLTDGKSVGSASFYLGNSAAPNATGSSNLSFGSGTFFSLTTGNNNIAIGSSAANTLTTGSSNILIGNAVNTSAPGASSELNIENLIYAQDLGSISDNRVGINTQVIDDSAVLEIASTTKGMLIPRMLEAERDAITTPATSLMIYQTDAISGFYYYDGSAWVSATGAKEINDLTDGVSDGTHNVFLGKGTGEQMAVNGFWNGQYNVGIGIEALKQGVDVSKSIAIGYRALYNDNTTRNTAIGYLALETVATGSGNTAIGPEVLKITNGSNNVGVGEFSLNELGATDNNTAIGSSAGSAITDGTENIFLGYSAAFSQTSGDQNIAIGKQVQLASLTGSNQLNIGDLIYGTNVYNATGRIGIGNGNNAPNSTLDVAGSMSNSAEILGANITLDETHHTVIGDNITVTLPLANSSIGRVYYIKAGSTGGLIIAPNGLSDKIDGSSSTITLAAYEYLKVQAIASGKWAIIGSSKSINTPVNSYPLVIALSDYTVTSSDYTIIFRHGTGSPVLTLPTAASAGNQIIVVTTTNGDSSEKVKIEAAGSDQIYAKSNSAGSSIEIGAGGVFSPTTWSVTLHSDAIGIWYVIDGVQD